MSVSSPADGDQQPWLLMCFMFKAISRAAVCSRGQLPRRARLCVDLAGSPGLIPLQMRTVAQVGGHGDDVNAVAYAEPDAPNVIFSGSDDSFVKVGRLSQAPVQPSFQLLLGSCKRQALSPAVSTKTCAAASRRKAAGTHAQNALASSAHNQVLHRVDCCWLHLNCAGVGPPHDGGQRAAHAPRRRVCGAH